MTIGRSRRTQAPWQAIATAAGALLLVAVGAGACANSASSATGSSPGQKTVLSSHQGHGAGRGSSGHKTGTHPSHSSPSSPAGKGDHGSLPKPTTKPKPKPKPAGKPIPLAKKYPGPSLSYGSTGAAVLTVQQRLTSLGYWLGTPNGVFGDSTEQAVWALQKAAGIQRDGVVGPMTRQALALGDVPRPKPASGYVIEVDLADDLLMFVKNGKIQHILNTSTGGGYYYSVGDMSGVAITPTGIFHIYSEIDGPAVDALGELWMPKFFSGGFAIHGDGYVPPEPVSHGCVRVSDEAIDWIWADNLAPIGTEVWIY